MQFTKNLIGIAAFGTLFLTACGEGAQGPAGNDGQGCTVSTNDSGQSVVTCADGTEAILVTGPEGPSGMDGMDGADGTDGAPGPRGMDGADGTDGAVGPMGMNGADGSDGSSCTVFENEDGTRTIACEDGTTVTVTNGADGVNGQDGNDGSSCGVVDNGDGTATIRCDDGSATTISDGRDGANGLDGTSCGVTQNENNTLTITCGDGSSVTIGSSDILGFAKSSYWRDRNGNGVFDGDDIRTRYAYNDVGQLVKRTDEHASDGVQSTRSYIYGPDGLLVQKWVDLPIEGDNTIDPPNGDFDGNDTRISYTYDAQGNLLTAKSEEANSGITGIQTYTYDANGNQLSFWGDKNANGLFDGTEYRTFSFYDEQGNGLSNVSEFAHIGVTNRLHRTYDEQGRELSSWVDKNGANGVFDGDETRTQSTYNDDGNLLTKISESADLGVFQTLTYTYDADGRLASFVRDGCKLTPISGCWLNVNGVFDEGEERSSHTYDRFGNQISTTEDDWYSSSHRQITQRTFSRGGNLLSEVTDQCDLSEDRNCVTNGIFDGSETRVNYTYNDNDQEVSRLTDYAETGETVSLRSRYDHRNNKIYEFLDTDNNGLLETQSERIKTWRFDIYNNLTAYQILHHDGLFWRNEFGYDALTLPDDPCANDPCSNLSYLDFEGTVSDRCVRGFMAEAVASRQQSMPTGAICMCSEALIERYGPYGASGKSYPCSTNELYGSLFDD